MRFAFNEPELIWRLAFCSIQHLQIPTEFIMVYFIGKITTNLNYTLPLCIWSRGVGFVLTLTMGFLGLWLRKQTELKNGWIIYLLNGIYFEFLIFYFRCSIPSPIVCWHWKQIYCITILLALYVSYLYQSKYGMNESSASTSMHTVKVFIAIFIWHLYNLEEAGFCTWIHVCKNEQ